MSDTSQSVIIERIKKMLALAERGGTEEEASTAANMAADVALKYGIDIAKLQVSDAPKKGFVDIAVFSTAKFEQWAMNIVDGVAKLNGCPQSFFTPGCYDNESETYVCRYSVIMRADMAPVVKMTIEYLVQAILRFNTKAVKTQKLGSAKARKSFRDSFRYSCASRLRTRMIERFEAMRTKDNIAQEAVGSNALVVADYFEREISEAQDWMKQNGFIFAAKEQRNKTLKSAAGMAAGRAAGEQIGIEAQVGKTQNAGSLI